MSCQIVVMEVSSQGLMLHRTAGIPFELSILQILSGSSVAEHANEDYIACRDGCSVGAASAL
ncbi:MAG: hypothetical protein ACLTSZ_08875 [Lachnospiraceae bacterium]